jgi:small-conductance mechanosensitive channel
MKQSIIKLFIFGLLAAGFQQAHLFGIPQVTVLGENSLANLLAAICGVVAGYELVLLGVCIWVRARHGVPGEVKMLSGLLRFAAAVIILIVMLYTLGYLSKVGAVVAGFAGLLMGWSLQAPVSGMAAWAMITVKRPFRVGDRIYLPSLGLNGDVMEVDPMYTSLNQVGGSIGSEEAIGRRILIPNAMLFTQVVINYTPEMKATGDSYFLDEVVVRVTFDTDWDAAEKILLEAAGDVTREIIAQTGQQPYIRSDFYDYGIYMRLRYMTLATDRPRITHEITQRVFRAFQRDLRVDLAIPYVYSYRHSLPSERFRYPSDNEAIEEIDINKIDDPQATEGALTQAEEEAIEDLTRHIQTVGLLQPLVLERQPDGRYRVIAGTNRLRACVRLGWTRVPATIHTPNGQAL